MTLLTISFFASLTYGIICQQSTLDFGNSQKVEVWIDHVPDNFTVYLEAVMGINTQNSSAGQNLSMNIDLTYNDVLVPAKITNFGFVCNEDSACTIGDTKSFSYQGISSDTANAANSLLRFTPADTKGKQLQGLDFTYFSPTQDWVKRVGPAGVLGLGPQSPFWKLLETTYTKPASGSYDISLKYKITNEEDMYKPSLVQMSDEAQMTLNGRTSTEKQVVRDFKSNYTAWVWEGNKITLHPGEDMTDVNLCIDDSLNTFFIANSSQYDFLKDKILKQLCSTNTTCHKSNSSFTNVDNMEITLVGNDKKKVVVTLGAIDFINFDSNDIAQFGIMPLNQSSVCSSQNGSVVYGVGRLFFTKAELTVKYLGGGKFQLAASQVPVEISNILFYIMLLTGAFILTVVWLIAAMNLPKKDPEEYAPEGAYKSAPTN